MSFDFKVHMCNINYWFTQFLIQTEVQYSLYLIYNERISNKKENMIIQFHE